MRKFFEFVFAALIFAAVPAMVAVFLCQSGCGKDTRPAVDKAADCNSKQVEQGRRANAIGVPANANPYQGMSYCGQESSAWLEGWMAAEEAKAGAAKK